MPKDTSGYVRPFTRDFVIANAFRGMIRVCDASIGYVISRIPDFDGNTEKGKELFETLTQLQGIKRSITEMLDSVCPPANQPKQ